MARRSCRNSALVRSYARKAGGDGSLQARFALRPTAPMFAHTRCSHIVWRAYGAAARVLTRAAAARSSLRGRRFLASARPMARPVSQLSALPRHACSHNRPPRSRCGGERTVRARLSRGAVRLRHPLAMTACPGVARPAPQQSSLPALLGIRLLPPPRSRVPNGSCMPHGHPAPQQLPVPLWSAAVFLDAAHKKATS